MNFMKKSLCLFVAFTMVLSTMGITVLAEETNVANVENVVAATNVAKIGNTYYTTIDEAIAAWTNGTTLALLSDVTLSGVIELSSTEMHTLDLGTYTMNAAANKSAISIIPNGRSSASYALDIKADATNPGGISATGGSCIYSKGKSGVKDRPIIRIYGGNFTGKYAINHSGSNGTNCPQFYIYGGTFDQISTNRVLLQIYGGTFTKKNWISPDSSAYTRIEGGRFFDVNNNMMSSLNSDKWTYGTSKGVFDVNVYIDEDGYYVVTKDAIDTSVMYPAANISSKSTLVYSKAYTEGLYYKTANTYLKNTTAGEVVLHSAADESIKTSGNLTIDMSASGADYAGDVTLGGKDHTFTVVFDSDNPYEGTVTPYTGCVLQITETMGTIVTRTYSNAVAIAKIGNTNYTSLQEAVDAAENGDTITLISDITLDETVKVSAGDNIILDLNGYTISQTKEQTEGYQMILNDGVLTINDSGVDGKISYTDSGNGGEYISDTIYNRGTLVINGGTIENISSATVASNGYPHAVDTYSGIRDTSATINGGTIYCAEYSAIRMFCVSATNTADLVINDGATIRGAVDMQNGNKDAALGSITVNGGTFETTKNANNIRFANWNGGATEYGIAAEIKGGSFNGGITSSYVPSAANWNNKIITGGTYSSDVSTHLADGYELDKNSDGTYSVVTATEGLEGEGTQDSPYLINNLNDLKWFRDQVDLQAADGTTQFTGKYFKLTADIDLDEDGDGIGENWNPIGSMSGDHGSFKGIFDGDGHTIFNLYVETSENGLGLFARTAGNAEIKNLTINNATLKSTDNSNYIGAVVANSYASTKINNVHVTGKIDILGRGYLGGISGHGYVVMDNCSVKAEGTIKSTFWCVGGILGYGGEGSTNITNSSVEGTGDGLLITSAAGGLGSIVGMAEDDDGKQPISGSNLSAKNVDIKTYEGAYGNSYANYALGYLYGGNPTSILTGTLSVEDVTIETSSGVSPKVNDAIATVGEKVFFSLEDALNAAEDGDTVTLLRDVTLDETIKVSAEDIIVLDLNGNTITGIDNSNTNFFLIDSYGDLTVKNGSITLTAENDREWNAASAIFQNRGGKLVIESGTYTHNGGTAMAYVVDNNANSFGDAVTIVNDGRLTSSYIAIRNRMDTYGANGGGNGTAELDINGGTFTGKYAIWGQVASTGVKGIIDISGGTFVAQQDKAAVLVDTDETGEITTAISGGTFSSDVSAYLADGYEIDKNSDGTYTVVAAEEKDIFGNFAFYVRNMDPVFEDTYRIALFAGIDSLKYKEVGFKMFYDDFTTLITKRNTIEVYTSITAGNTTIEASEQGVFRIFGIPIDMSTDWDNYRIIFQPYAIDLQGNEIPGQYYPIDDIYTLNK